MGRRTRAEAEETRGKILVAALELMSEKGYSRTTFVDVAERIGLTKGAVYWHFSSKQELFIALIRFFYQRREQLVGEQAIPLASLEDVQPHFIERSRVIMQDPLCRQFAYFLSFQMEWTEELYAAAQEVLDDLQEDLFQQLFHVMSDGWEKGVLKQEISPRDATILIISLWKGLFANDVRHYTSMDLEHCVEVGMDVMMQGLRNPDVAVACKE
jgi:AcrR family transcriptional regulator